MSKTKVTNKEIAEAFKVARKRISTGKNTFICPAVNRPENGYYGMLAQGMIETMLEGCYTYEGWLQTFHPATHKQMKPKDLKEGRLQWLDSLIEEFSNKPDEGELKNV